MPIKFNNNITFRLDDSTGERLNSVTQRTGLLPSQLIRLALQQALPEWERHGVTIGAPHTFHPETLATQKTVTLPVFVGN